MVYQPRQIRRGTYAQRVALGGLAAAEFGFETDTLDLYVGCAAGDKLIADRSALDFLIGQDQEVKKTASPTFAGAIIGGFSITAKATGNFGLGSGFPALTTGDYNVHLGVDCQVLLTTGEGNVAIGYKAQAGGVIVDQDNVAIGYYAQYALTGAAGCTGVGHRSQEQLTLGDYNSAFGDKCQNTITTGYNNCGFGYKTQEFIVGGYDNCAFGYASQADVTGHDNNAFGYIAQANLTTGNYNNAFGNSAMSSNAITGSENCAFGGGSLEALIAGFKNCAFGMQTLTLLTSGAYNTAIGWQALFNVLTTHRNTALGAEAGYTNAADYNIFLGYQAGFFETGSSKLFIDNIKRASEADGRIKALIYGIFGAASANQRLRINARLGVTHLPNYANNAAAVAGGLISGEFYTVTGSDPLQVAAVV